MSTTETKPVFPIAPSWDSSLGWVWNDDQAAYNPDRFAKRLELKYHKVGTFKSTRSDRKLSRIYFNEDMKEIAQFQYSTGFFVVLHSPRVWDLQYYRNSFDWS
jgi:hypothetical protein